MTGPVRPVSDQFEFDGVRLEQFRPVKIAADDALASPRLLPGRFKICSHGYKQAWDGSGGSDKSFLKVPKNPSNLVRNKELVKQTDWDKVTVDEPEMKVRPTDADLDLVAIEPIIFSELPTVS